MMIVIFVIFMAIAWTQAKKVRYDDNENYRVIICNAETLTGFKSQGWPFHSFIWNLPNKKSGNHE